MAAEWRLSLLPIPLQAEVQPVSEQGLRVAWQMGHQGRRGPQSLSPLRSHTHLSGSQALCGLQVLSGYDIYVAKKAKKRTKTIQFIKTMIVKLILLGKPWGKKPSCVTNVYTDIGYCLLGICAKIIQVKT